ncbi:MAG: tRNA glutamyl-Q(34) synthetase GluQRS [Alphaproteobacteria bacterium]
MKAVVTTRFAPSPTGLMHLGHAYSALFAYDLAKAAGGLFILRIEDIDTTRKRPEYVQAIIDDLSWLGLEWQLPVRQQSEHLVDYEKQLNKLQNMGVIYPCYCSRKEINATRDKILHAPHQLEEIYPKICLNRPQDEINILIAQGREPAYRLNLDKALNIAPLDDYWYDLYNSQQAMNFHAIGDIILARRDIKTSYHLAVTYDDYLQNISLITRGCDLLPITPLHILLQKLLGYSTPYYAHHDLIKDDNQMRLAKSQNAPSLQSLRKQGTSPQDIRKQIGATGKKWQIMLEKILIQYS